jgi:hypothetical protein
MKLEIATLEAINAWSVIDCFDHHVIASTWAFKCKCYPDGLQQRADNFEPFILGSVDK